MLKWHEQTVDDDNGLPCEAFGYLMDTRDDEKAPYGSYQVEEDNTVSWHTDLTDGVVDTVKEAKEMVERKMMCCPLENDGPCVGRYDDIPYKFGKTYTVRRFRTMVKHNDLTDMDGHGHPIKDRKMDSELIITPSRVKCIPEDADHVQWYSK